MKDIFDAASERIFLANRVFDVLGSSELSDWEAGFIEDIHKLCLRGVELTESQHEKFLEIERRVNG